MKYGFSLIELLVVMTIISLLVALAIPAINAMQKSYDSTGAESMVGAALATARSFAISKGQYTGVRFQMPGGPNDMPDADQYMIFIIEDANNKPDWKCGFTAIDGYKPIKLPSNTGVTDKTVWRARSSSSKCNSTCPEETLVDADMVDDVNIIDISTFSVVFSSSGRLVTHNLRCARRSDYDDIFNTKNDVELQDPNGMFIEDNHENFGTGVEKSRKAFVLYDRDKFKNLKTGKQRRDYIDSLKVRHVNTYTGEIIK